MPIPSGDQVSPSVEDQGGASLDGADDDGGVLDRIWWQAAGVGPHELGAFGWLANDGLAVPVAGFEREPDAGVRGAEVALVDGQGQAQGSGSRAIPVSSLVSRMPAWSMFSPSAQN